MNRGTRWEDDKVIITKDEKGRHLWNASVPNIDGLLELLYVEVRNEKLEKHLKYTKHSEKIHLV